MHKRRGWCNLDGDHVWMWIQGRRECQVQSVIDLLMGG